MKDLTSQEFQQLLGKIKSFLNITWTDIPTDTEITDMIYSSISDLDERAGVELDYLLQPNAITGSTPAEKLYNRMSYLAQDLLKNRVFYMREKALDDFEPNYQRALNKLFLDGKIYKAKVRENASQENL